MSCWNRIALLYTTDGMTERDGHKTVVVCWEEEGFHFSVVFMGPPSPCLMILFALEEQHELVVEKRLTISVMYLCH